MHLIFGDNMDNYVIRNDQIEEVWMVTYIENGFKKPIFIQGTENEFRAYMEYEFGYVGAYTALSTSEIAAVKKLRLPIYLAPEIDN
jgi:hypothetical protein